MKSISEMSKEEALKVLDSWTINEDYGDDEIQKLSHAQKIATEALREAVEKEKKKKETNSKKGTQIC